MASEEEEDAESLPDAAVNRMLTVRPMTTKGSLSSLHTTDEEDDEDSDSIDALMEPPPLDVMSSLIPVIDSRATSKEIRRSGSGSKHASRTSLISKLSLRTGGSVTDHVEAREIIEEPPSKEIGIQMTPNLTSILLLSDGQRVSRWGEKRGSQEVPSLRFSDMQNAPMEDEGESSAESCRSYALRPPTVPRFEAPHKQSMEAYAQLATARRDIEQFLAHHARKVQKSCVVSLTVDEGVQTDIPPEVSIHESEDLANESEDLANESEDLANESEDLADESGNLANESANARKDLANASKDLANENLNDMRVNVDQPAHEIYQFGLRKVVLAGCEYTSVQHHQIPNSCAECDQEKWLANKIDWRNTRSVRRYANERLAFLNRDP